MKTGLMLNPILRREAKTGLRKKRTFFGMFIYSGIIAGIMAVCIGAMFFNSNQAVNPAMTTGLYVAAISIQMFMMMLITPAATAGSISGERERQTLDLLLVTRMSSLSIIIGKLLSSMGIVVLLVISSMPVIGMLFYFGGVSLLNVLGSIVFMLVTAFMAASVAIFFSTLFRKTIASIIMTFMTLGALCIVSPVSTSVFYLVYYNQFNKAPPALAGLIMNSINPAMGFISLVDYQLGTNVTNMAMDISGRSASALTELFGTYFWLVNAIISVIIAVFFIFLATIRLSSLAGKK